MKLLGITFYGLNADNLHKLLLSGILIGIVLIVAAAARLILRLVLRDGSTAAVQTKFWLRQAIALLTAVAIIAGLLSIWFNDPGRLATAFGLFSAGIAFALQQVITSIASYFVILRGPVFTVGDRIAMGGVRGDVLRLGFIQTTIMEMGEPSAMQGSDMAMWVHSRQFTGRVVTVSNSKIFSDPVYNYTRDFPFIWEEMMLPVTYKADRAHVEAIMLEAVRRNALDQAGMAAHVKKDIQERFGVQPIDLEPRVFMRLTDNWLELTVRFIVATHGIRGVKDAMSRYIIDELDKAGIGIASSTYDIVGLPPILARLVQSDSAVKADVRRSAASPLS